MEGGRRKCSEEFRKPEIPPGSPAVLYVVPADHQIFPLCTLMLSQRDQSACPGPSVDVLPPNSLIPELPALYPSLLTRLGLSRGSLELIMGS